MLRELQGVRQDKPGLKRRWYQDDFFDLYTWTAPAGALASFQLCYDLRGRERVLSWHRSSGFAHNGVDAGDAVAGQSATPLLVAGGRFPHRLVRTRFTQHAGTLDGQTRIFILDKMREYGRLAARGAIEMPPRHRAPERPSDPD